MNDPVASAASKAYQQLGPELTLLYIRTEISRGCDDGDFLDPHGCCDDCTGSLMKAFRRWMLVRVRSLHRFFFRPATLI